MHKTKLREEKKTTTTKLHIWLENIFLGIENLEEMTTSKTTTKHYSICLSSIPDKFLFEW